MINSNEFEKNALKEVMEVKRDRFRVNIRKKDVENKLKLRRNQLFSPPEKQFKENKGGNMNKKEDLTSQSPYHSQDYQYVPNLLVGFCEKIINLKGNDYGIYFLHCIQDLSITLKEIEEEDLENLISLNCSVLQAFDFLIIYSQGYQPPVRLDSLDLIMNCSHTLKRLVQFENIQLTETLLDHGMLETIFFLLGKNDRSLQKKGVQIIQYCVKTLDLSITDKIFYSEISKDCNQKLLKLLPSLDCQSMRRRLIKSICYSMMASDQCFEYFVDTDVINYFIEEVMNGSPLQNFIMNTLKYILEFYQIQDDGLEDYIAIKQRLKIYNFIEFLNSQAFEKDERFSRKCQEILYYFEQK